MSPVAQADVQLTAALQYLPPKYWGYKCELLSEGSYCCEDTVTVTTFTKENM